MEANELRIGNYVESDNTNCYINFFLGSAVVDLELIGFDSTDDNHEMNIEDIKPITVTKEWLLKLGFKDGGDEFVINDFHFSLCYSSVAFRPSYDSNGINIELPIKVHQLQNLYFALTGEELCENI